MMHRHSKYASKFSKLIMIIELKNTSRQPLSNILNLSRIISSPHGADQISVLWAAYHASRSGGTGRGFICASIPLASFKQLEQRGRRYPSFVVPVPRMLEEVPPEVPSAEGQTPHEFYYLQWDFHASPEVPSAEEDLFGKSAKTSSLSNPQACTVLFTPLQEYKLRGSFATPYLVLTLYTDLAATHGVVLLRGEITPSSSSGDRYILTQADAQFLALALQKFYLWNTGNGSSQTSEGERLLRAFHETPQDFKWEDLLKFSKLTM
jgi:ATP synthase F1 complex assembly factor 1